MERLGLRFQLGDLRLRRRFWMCAQKGVGRVSGSLQGVKLVGSRGGQLLGAGGIAAQDITLVTRAFDLGQRLLEQIHL